MALQEEKKSLYHWSCQTVTSKELIRKEKKRKKKRRKQKKECQKGFMALSAVHFGPHKQPSHLPTVVYWFALADNIKKKIYFKFWR